MMICPASGHQPNHTVMMDLSSTPNHYQQAAAAAAVAAAQHHEQQHQQQHHAQQIAQHQSMNHPTANCSVMDYYTCSVSILLAQQHHTKPL